MNTDYLAANRANWDERVESHLVAYDTAGFVADGAARSSVVLDDLAAMAPFLANESVEGLRLVHLQCHIGTDTLSWARLGADVTGVDFSAHSVAAARSLATSAGLDATFIESTVDDAVDHVDGQFDIVYTGIGAITWLSDLDRWASTIRRLLREGLVLLSFDEQRVIPWQTLPSMIEVDGGYALPDHDERLPLTFSLIARRPQ